MTNTSTKHAMPAPRRPLIPHTIRLLAVPIILFWVFIAVLVNTIAPTLEEVGEAHAAPMTPKDAPSMCQHRHEIRGERGDLMVADLVTWAKSEGIAVGPGRGSAAGSLVCYLLHITEIDSMQFPMLFGRFLDPTRTDPPDIDIDFEDDRKDEVFAYAATKYGQEYVANIGTFTSTPISASQR